MIGLGQSGLCPEGGRGSNPCKPFVCPSWEGEERMPSMTTTGFYRSKKSPWWRTRVISLSSIIFPLLATTLICILGFILPSS